MERLPVGGDLTLQAIEHEALEVVAAPRMRQNRRRIASQGGECVRHALTTRLMAGRARIGVSLRADGLPLEYTIVRCPRVRRQKREKSTKANPEAIRHRSTL